MSVTVPRPIQRRRALGFSLIELLIAISVVGILAALVMPKVRIDNSQVDAAARTFGMAVMAAQRDAAARQHNVLLVIDTAGHNIQTVWDANNNGIADSGERTRPFPLPERVQLGRPSSVSALGTATASVPSMLTSNGKPMLVLQRNGSVDRTVTLYLSTSQAMAGGSDKDTRAVVIARATARSEWYAWGNNAWTHGR